MQRLGSLKDIVHEKLNTISNKCKLNTTESNTSSPSYNPHFNDMDDSKNEKNSKNNANHNNNKCENKQEAEDEVESEDCVEWHNYSIKELLSMSKENGWNEVSNDVRSLIVSLSKHKSLKNNHKELAQIQQQKSENSNEAVSILQCLRSEFECDICLDFYVEPLTLSCGHTFCRLCIISMQSKFDKKCPLCKACSHIDPCLHAQTIVISNSVKSIFGQNEYKQRMSALEKVRQSMKRNIPVFVMNMVRYPGMKMHLHLFEPRYLHMINRAISSGNKFAYLCSTMNDNGNGYQPYENDVASLVKIEECQFLPDGRCLMQGVIEKRIVVTSCWVEKGTQGLWYVKYADYMDVRTANGNDNGNNDEGDQDEIDADHLQLIEKFVEFIYNKSSHIIKSIENEIGQRVHLGNHNREEWSFWVCSLLYIVKQHEATMNWIKHAMHTKNTMDRIKSCYDVLKPQAHIWNGNE